jgi:hypothetical protein
MTTFAGITPSADNTQINYTYRTNNYQLGDGYKDVSPDGINGQIIAGQVQWDNLSAPQWASLQAWLATVPPWVTWAGDGIALPTNRQFRITEDGYQITFQPGGVVQVQLNVELYN